MNFRHVIGQPPRKKSSKKRKYVGTAHEIMTTDHGYYLLQAFSGFVPSRMNYTDGGLSC